MIATGPAQTSEMPAAAFAERRFSYSSRALGVRLFLTAWLVYAAHVATNTVREIYPALSMGDHFSFRVDEYANLHPDLFEKPGYGWHINSNPGASMLAAIPYALARPVIDRVVARVNAHRAGQQPPPYNSPWPMARAFYQASWRLGLDVKFGLAAIVIQAFCMAPFSAAGVLAMFLLLRHLFHSDRVALWLSLLYAFGTPAFFRAGYLNQNMLLGHAVFIGFLALWHPAPTPFWTVARRNFAAGFTGGLAVLLDYTGVVMLACLAAYALWRRRRTSTAAWFAAGAAIPLALLMFYQWQSFGNPILPAQHWIQVKWVEVGYKGLSLPMPDLLRANLLDYRYGLFVSCPMLLLAAAAPFLRRPRLSGAAMAMLLGAPAALWLFSSSVSYARLQFNSGVRYMAPAVPFLFVAAAMVLMRIPRRAAWFLAVAAVAQAWSMAMYRDVERGFGVLDSMLHVFLGGFQLPLLTVLSRIGGSQAEYFWPAASPLPLFALVGCLLFGIWSRRLEGWR